MTDGMQHLRQLDADCVLHPASSITDLRANGPTLITHAQGNTIVDSEGKHLLDAVAGLWCVNVGYGRKVLAEAMARSAETLGYYHCFNNASNIDQIKLADTLLQLAPESMSKVFFGTGGSDANDTLVKIAWHYHFLRGDTQKIKIIAREQAYHGTSISTASLTGLPSFHKDFPLPLDFVLRTDCPHYYRFARSGESLEAFCDRLIGNIAALIDREGADKIAAFIAEPIQAAGGVIEPPDGYFKKLRRLLSAHNILLIADEVVCGMGRLGAWFGSSLFEMQPDMIATAKGLTSGYFPLSAAFMSEPIYQTLQRGSEKLGGFFHGYTYSGHPVGAAVALANIEVLQSENLLQNAAELGAYLHNRLREQVLPHPLVGEIRGRGLLAGVQLVRDKHHRTLPETAQKWPQQLAALIRKSGVIVRPLPSVATLAISPPLTIRRDEIDTLVAAMYAALETFYTQLQR